MTKPIHNQIIVFADGSSLGNPGPGGWGAIILFNEQNDGKSKVKSQKSKVVELGGYDEDTTNNRMELTAAIQALDYVYRLKTKDYGLVVYTDSNYALSGITKWIDNWIENDWKTADKKPVQNQDLWQELIKLTTEYETHSAIIWHLIRGHAGILGNERADMIATSFAAGNPLELFKGSFEEYEKVLGGKIIKDIHGPNLGIAGGGPDFTPKTMPAQTNKRSQAKAYSYLSLVDGVLEKHDSWDKCEARVKGKSGAKFKKALSKEDEEKIIKKWQE